MLFFESFQKELFGLGRKSEGSVAPAVGKLLALKVFASQPLSRAFLLDPRPFQKVGSNEVGYKVPLFGSRDSARFAFHPS